ncbi:pro-FMRFamide-related neuropeptide VF precursor-like [Arapaima gigas]
MRRTMASLQLTVGILGSLMLRGIAGVRLRGYEPSSVEVRQPVQQSQYPETSHGNLRSLEMDSFQFKVAPTSGKVSIPTMLRLYPSVGKASPLHANLPLRFGRASPTGVLRIPKSSLNLPQRFGRAQTSEWSAVVSCHQCPRSGVLTSPSATLPQRFGRTAAYRKPLDLSVILAQGLSAALATSRKQDSNSDIRSVEDDTGYSAEELYGSTEH